jgi:hypothetical protein
MPIIADRRRLDLETNQVELGRRMQNLSGLGVTTP